MDNVISEYAAPNECGVYTEEVCEVIEYPGKDWRISIKIQIAHVGPNDWRYGCNTMTTRQGVGFGPSNHSPVFNSFQEAREDAARELIKCFKKYELDEHKSFTKEIAWLRSLSQLSLF